MSVDGTKRSGCWFAPDSPLEGEGFEPPVPRRDSIFETAPETGGDKPAR
jgi:hypothetical protein